jgi:hypothetical protein
MAIDPLKDKPGIDQLIENWADQNLEARVNEIISERMAAQLEGEVNRLIDKRIADADARAIEEFRKTGSLPLNRTPAGLARPTSSDS